MGFQVIRQYLAGGKVEDTVYATTDTINQAAHIAFSLNRTMREDSPDVGYYVRPQVEEEAVK